MSSGPPRGPRRVLVVGAGLSGLAAALQLQDAGHSVTVLEAEREACAWLAPLRLGDAEVEPELVTVPARAPELGRLAAQLDVASELQLEPIDEVALARGARLRLCHLHGLGWPGAAPGVPPWQARRFRRARRLAEWFSETLDPERPELATRLDDRSAADFARLYLGRRAHARLLQPLLETHFGLDAEVTSRVLLMLLLERGAGPSLARVHGLSALARALAARVADLRTGERVGALRVEAGRVVTDGGVEGDAAVLAVPACALAGLLPDPSPFERLVLSGLRAGERIVLAVRLLRPQPLPAPVVWIPAEEKGHLAGLARAGSDAGSPALLLFGRASLGEAGLDERSLQEALLRDAERVVPGLRAALGERALHRGRRTIGAFDVGYLRAAARLRDGLSARTRARPIAYCGDWLVGPHVEGALVAGRRCAVELDLGLA